MAPITGDGMTVGLVVLPATMIGVEVEMKGWLAVGVCSGDGPTAKVTTGPTLCSAGRDGMIVAKTSLEVRLPAGIASMLTPLLEELGLRTTPAPVVAGTMEASIIPATPLAEVAGLPAFSAAVMT